MNFLFNLLKTKSSDTPEIPKAEEITNQRVHARFKKECTQFISIQLQDGGKLQPNDLSYGGVHFRCDQKILDKLKNQKSISVTITSLGKSLQLKGDISHTNHTAVGLSFHHSTAESLNFLRDILENLRKGSTIRTIDPDLVKESNKSNWEHYMRGEGPTDIFLLNSLNCLVIFRDGVSYKEASWKDGNIFTGHSIGDLTKETRMTRDESLNKDTLRTVAYLLAGIDNPPQGEEINKLIEEIKNLLK